MSKNKPVFYTHDPALSVASNISNFISTRVGQLVDVPMCAKVAHATSNNASAAMHRLHVEHRLRNPKSINGIRSYEVTPLAATPRKATMKKKPFKHVNNRSDTNGFDFKVEKGIPIPDANRAGKYPFDVMKKGDSFLFPLEVRGKVNCAAGRHTRKNPSVAFTIKKVGSKSARCWRIK